MCLTNCVLLLKRPPPLPVVTALTYSASGLSMGSAMIIAGRLMGSLDARMLTCDRLSKTYPGGKKEALSSVSYSVPVSGTFVLIGRNGSGKTTLIRILATELEPTSGRASFDGLDVMRDAVRLREKIAIVPQEARTVPWMTPMQTVSSYLLWRGFGYSEARRRAADALDSLGMKEHMDRLNRTLSGGMKRKVLVAAVLSSDAEIIFLDEPTTGLDPVSRREFWELMHEIERERFTFLTTHYLEEAEALGDRIGMLEGGKLVRIGTLEDLRRSIRHSYSIVIPSGQKQPALSVGDGEVMSGGYGSRILTGEEEAFRISKDLIKDGIRFSINPVSLDDIFFYLVSREGIEYAGNQGEDLEQLHQHYKEEE